MAENVRATIYFNPTIYRALRIKAAEVGETVSGLVTRAVLESLREDRIDLEAFESRKREPRRPLADVLRALKRDGLL
jgi:hypothetical protein